MGIMSKALLEAQKEAAHLSAQGRGEHVVRLTYLRASNGTVYDGVELLDADDQHLQVIMGETDAFIPVSDILELSYIVVN